MTSGTRPSRPRGGAVAVVAVLLGLGIVIASAVLWSTGSRAERPSPVPVVDRGSLPTAGTTSGAAAQVAGSGQGTVPDGSRLLVPRLHVDAPIGSVRAPGGVMQIPRDPRRVAWWRDGAAPGDAAGSAVIVGHINFRGVAGALSALPRLRPGDAVTLDEPGRGALRYRVQAVRTYPKTGGLPTVAFRRDGPARLVLITCGGPFDPVTGNYEDNIAVYAAPVQ